MCACVHVRMHMAGTPFAACARPQTDNVHPVPPASCAEAGAAKAAKGDAAGPGDVVALLRAGGAAAQGWVGARLEGLTRLCGTSKAEGMSVWWLDVGE